MNSLMPFKELDGGTLFRCSYSWQHENETTNEKTARTAEGVWLWEDVRTVQTMSEETFPQMQGPRCAVLAAEGWIYLHAEFEIILEAWRRYRLAYERDTLRFTKSN